MTVAHHLKNLFMHYLFDKRSSIIGWLARLASNEHHLFQHRDQYDALISFNPFTASAIIGIE